MKPNHLASALLALCLAPITAPAAITMPAIFGNHMVLQQNQTIPVWGWAEPGEKVTVSLASRQETAVADAQGAWIVRFPPAKAMEKPVTLTVKGANQLVFEDVLIGNVWLASGQSNMEFGIQTDIEGLQATATTDARLRMFFVPWSTSLEPQKDLGNAGSHPMNGKWIVCTPQTMKANWAWHGFSAVGYYFGRYLLNATHQPVGMIGSYKGGTPAEAWTSLEGLKAEPSLARHVEVRAKVAKEYPAKSETYPGLVAAAQQEWKAQQAKWQEDSAAALRNGQPEPVKPVYHAPSPPDGGFSTPANNFNGMIAPLIPYAIQGVIWYQGESNADDMAEAKEYADLFPALIRDWRSHWQQGDFPFLYVQLAAFRPKPSEPVEHSPWPLLREAQLKTLSLPRTAMASAVDVGDANDIHPVHKRTVGKRLALAARHVALREKLTFSGPLFESAKIDGDKARIQFSHVGGGLMIGSSPWQPGTEGRATGDHLHGFAVAGEDRRFVSAKAEIEGGNIIVSSPDVSKPVAVRYGWAAHPTGNLYNADGLPASPFRTDDW